MLQARRATGNPLGLGLAAAASGAETASSPEPDKARKDDVAKLARKLEEATARINALLREAQAQRGRAVAAEIEARTAKGTIEALERQVAKLTREVANLSRELARLRADKGGDPAVKPAPENIEGLVRQVKDGKVRISLGTDAGLARGHTLEVFRLSPAPRYLGRLRVVEVTAKEAICQQVGRKAEIKEGDRVASRILPSPSPRRP